VTAARFSIFEIFERFRTTLHSLTPGSIAAQFAWADSAMLF
jgi:hypothetical protein